MKVFVGCGSSKDVDKKYLESAYELGSLLAKNSHTLIFGSSDEGMMGELYRGVRSSNGKVISVYPENYNGFLKEVESYEVIKVPTTSSQLINLTHMGDVTIIMPGSFGTLTELISSIFWKKIGEHNKKILILNIDGFFDEFLLLIDKIYDKKFDFSDRDSLYTIVSTPKEAINFLENL